MIEYGAGGQITHSEAPGDAVTPPVPAPSSPVAPQGQENGTQGEEDITAARSADGPAADDENGPAPSGSEANAPQPQVAAMPTPAIPTVGTARRKRKAKGWACPVCRQRMLSPGSRYLWYH